MTSEGEFDHNVIIRNLLANIQTGDNATSSGSTDCVAQLLAAAAAAQLGSNAVTTYNTDTVDANAQASLNGTEVANNREEQNITFNPILTSDIDGGELHDETVVETTIEVPTTVKRKPLCVKYPVELRKRIIAMRKEGKRCVEVSKELHVSVSGAQKVWERFLATGTVHDRKPSTYAGRPRKYSHQVCP